MGAKNHSLFDTFDFYAMLGLPNENAEQITNHEDGMKSLTTFPSPALLFLEGCELPSGVAPASNRQFVARINPHADLKSIIGMGGGPILGFRMNTNGQLQYWPVAVQSRWFRKRRIVVGSLLAPVAAEIERGIEGCLARGNSMEAPFKEISGTVKSGKGNAKKGASGRFS